jgi:hypothetical protein
VRKLWTVLAFISVSSLLLVAPTLPRSPTAAPAHAVSCTTNTHVVIGADGASAQTNTGVNGAAGTVYIPYYSPSFLNGQRTSGASVVAATATQFWQLGWYVGDVADEGLPFTQTPRLFFGEGRFDTHEESLVPLDWVGEGSFPTLSLRRNETTTSPDYRKFYAFVNGTLKRVSTTTTSNWVTPRFTGETNFECAYMDGYAASSSGGKSLMGHRQSTGYSFWQEHHYKNNIQALGRSDWDCWTNVLVNGYAATVSAYGPSSTTCT